MQCLAKICEAEQGKWSTSIEEDGKWLKNNRGGGRLRRAVLFRLEKKQILSKCLTHFKTKAGLKGRGSLDRGFAEVQ